MQANEINWVKVGEGEIEAELPGIWITIRRVQCQRRKYWTCCNLHDNGTWIQGTERHLADLKASIAEQLAKL